LSIRNPARLRHCALIVHNGQTVIRPGEIRYNDPCSYRRTTLSDGLTVR